LSVQLVIMGQLQDNAELEHSTHSMGVLGSIPTPVGIDSSYPTLIHYLSGDVVGLLLDLSFFETL
jgi:hypothetical protein